MTGYLKEHPFNLMLNSIKKFKKINDYIRKWKKRTN